MSVVSEVSNGMCRNVLTAHGTHALPLGPVYPALHRHASVDPEPSGDDENGGHVRHVEIDAAADVSEYLPTPHCVHVDAPLTGLNLPETHAVQL